MLNILFVSGIYRALYSETSFFEIGCLTNAKEPDYLEGFEIRVLLQGAQ